MSVYLSDIDPNIIWQECILKWVSHGSFVNSRLNRFLYLFILRTICPALSCKKVLCKVLYLILFD